MPELRAVAHLLEQVGDDARRVEAHAGWGNAELRFGQVAGEDAGVIAIALNRAGVAWDAVLLEPRGALGDRSGEENAGPGRAFPEGRLGRKPALAEGRDPQRGQVAKRRDETGRGDDVVRRNGELAPGRIPRANPITRAFLHDLFDGRVEKNDPARQRGVLVRLNIAGADADQ